MRDTSVQVHCLQHRVHNETMRGSRVTVENDKEETGGGVLTVRPRNSSTEISNAEWMSEMYYTVCMFAKFPYVHWIPFIH